MKRTKIENHYWNNNGAYEKEFSELTKSLMPASGRAETLRGEAVRAANRLYYEYCNNGNCNARVVDYAYKTDCPFCGGSGYVCDDGVNETLCPYCAGRGTTLEGEDTCEISEFYNDLLKLLRFALIHDDDAPHEFIAEAESVIDSIEEFILNNDCDGRDAFSDANMHKYDLLIDLVAEYALTRDDKRPIPNWYTN